MNFKLINDLVGNIIRTIEQTAIIAVKAIKAHTFKTQVSNFPKTQAVKGVVVVSNQKKVERGIHNLGTLIQAVLKAVHSIKAPKSIEVSNLKELPKPPKFPKFPEEITVKNPTKIPPYPKKIYVSNQPVKELNKIVTAVGKVAVMISALKLNPKINVEAPRPQRLVVPPAKVIVQKEKFDYKKLAKTISKQIPNLDYKKLSEAIGKEIAQMVVTIGGSGGRRKEGQDDLTREYNISDKDVANPVKYYGFIGRSGQWYIMKEDGTEYRYIKGSNGYEENWTGRTDLEYDFYNEVF